MQELLATAGSWIDLRRAPLLRALVAAEPGTGRWLAMLGAHHLVLDHLGVEVVLGEITALLRGEGNRLPDPLPLRDFVAQARLGVPREEHERYFAGLLGDVSEPTAPFGLLDVRGDGSDAARARVTRWMRSWRGGCGSGRGRRGLARRRCSIWCSRGCWR